MKVGDVVYAEGASAIIGDVLKVERDGPEDDDQALTLVTVRWRETVTTEIAEDLILDDPLVLPDPLGGGDPHRDKDLR